MTLSMFSCSHFFFSNRKQRVHSAMSKRGQEGTSGESLPNAEFGDGEAEIYFLGAVRQSSNFSSRDMSDSESPGNVEV